MKGEGYKTATPYFLKKHHSITLLIPSCLIISSFILHLSSPSHTFLCNLQPHKQVQMGYGKS